MVGHMVFGCGCTDCFPHALFKDRVDAESWAIANCTNHEGYIIRSIADVEDFVTQWDDE